MRPKLTTTTLLMITKHISEGALVRGLSIANEYLEPTDPLRAALVKKAMASPRYSMITSPSWIKVQNGFRLFELTEGEREDLSLESIPGSFLCRSVCIPEFKGRRTKRSGGISRVGVRAKRFVIGE